MNETDEMLFDIFNDPEKSMRAKGNTKRIILLNYYYRLRINRLNQLLTSIEELKQMRKKQNG